VVPGVSATAARVLAHEVLVATRERQAYVTPVIDTYLARADLPETDRSFVTRLARGVVETAGVLDEALDVRLDRPGRVEPRVRDALRMGAYELLFLTTEPRAAVHQYVDLVRSLRPQAAGMANAVLRKIADAAPDFPWGDVASDVSALARATGHPLWLAEQILHDLGAGPGRIALESAMTPAPLFVRVNPFMGTLEEALTVLEEDGADPEPAWPDELARQLLEPRAAIRGRAVAEGFVIVSDAAAQFAPLAVESRPGSRVLDACAGRGTKTLTLQASAVACGAPARVLALDISTSKIAALARRMEYLGVPSIEGLAGDVLDPSVVENLGPASFDAVLLDAPCSGTGTMRRHPEIRWALSPADVIRLSELQRAMLARAASLVKPGGALVYSTCSILLAETVHVIRDFLDGASGADFESDSVERHIPTQWTRFLTTEGWFRSWPEPAGADGHFVARMVRHTRA
jgi:16S rRNA (cytosine967-C5)-methyltransferase